MGAIEAVAARFAPGARVRVRRADPPGARVRVRRADPPGHVRTPWYCRGHAGVIERICGSFANPEELAYNRDGLPAQPLYRVRFLCRDLWHDYAGNAGDVVEIEIFQHWLEPV